MSRKIFSKVKRRKYAIAYVKIHKSLAEIDSLQHLTKKVCKHLADDEWEMSEKNAKKVKYVVAVLNMKPVAVFKVMHVTPHHGKVEPIPGKNKTKKPRNQCYAKFELEDIDQDYDIFLRMCEIRFVNSGHSFSFRQPFNYLWYSRLKRI